MVEMCVGQKDMTNRVQILKRQVTYAGTCVDQDVIVDEHGRGTRPGTNATTATQNSYLHRVGVLLIFAMWDDSFSGTLG